jgi:hypothetical protein
LKGSGSLSYIQNDSLSKKIAKYYAFTEHLEQDYDNDKSLSEYARQQISTVVNINYEYAVVHYQTAPDKLPSIEEIEEFPEYRKALLANLGLITNDIDKFNIAINSLIPVNRNMKVRKKKEFPDLIEDAEELISLLKKEYHD